MCAIGHGWTPWCPPAARHQVRSVDDVVQLAKAPHPRTAQEWWLALVINEEGWVLNAHPLYEGAICHAGHDPAQTAALIRCLRRHEAATVISVRAHGHAYAYPCWQDVEALAGFVGQLNEGGIYVRAHLILDPGGVRWSFSAQPDWEVSSTC